VSDEGQTGRLTMLGLAATAAFAGLVVMLDHAVALDDWVWRRVLLARGCAADAITDDVVDGATNALIVLLALATVLHVRARGWRSAWPWIGGCGLALVASKTLKHVLTRERPSMLPDAALGFSFPSAHALNGVAAAIAIVALAAGFRRRNAWWAAVVLPTAVVTVGRVALGRHWTSDVVGGVLAAVALMGILVPRIRQRPVLAPVASALALGLLLLADHRLGDAGVELPAPLVGASDAFVEVDVGVGGAGFSGAWREEERQRPADTFRWLEDRGAVALDVSRDVAGEAAPRLAFGARTEKPRPACMSVAVELNGRAIGAFVPFDGWREYRLPIPVGLLREGRNEVAVSVAAANAPARLALSYLRIGRRSGAD
jgi:undecaprenyl-diphosphatase